MFLGIQLLHAQAWLYNVPLFYSGKKKLVNQSLQPLVGKIVEQAVFLTAFNHTVKSSGLSLAHP